MTRTTALAISVGLASVLALGACKKRRQPTPPVEESAAETLEPLEAPPPAAGGGEEQLAAQVAAARAEDEKLLADPKTKEEIEKFCTSVYAELEKVRAGSKKPVPKKDDVMATCTSLPPYALRCIEPEFASQNQQACEAYVGALPKPTVDAIGRMYAWFEGKDPAAAEGEASAGGEAEAAGSEANKAGGEANKAGGEAKETGGKAKKARGKRAAKTAAGK